MAMQTAAHNFHPEKKEGVTSIELILLAGVGMQKTFVVVDWRSSDFSFAILSDTKY
jgi:hypothetical protein